MGELVVARGDAAEVFQSIEHPLDEITLLVGFEINRPLVSVCRGGGDDGSGSPEREVSAKLQRIIANVAEQTPFGGQRFDGVVGGGDVGNIAGRQVEAEQPPVAVGDRVDFGRPATARTADRLRLRPPFPPAPARCTLIEVLSIERISCGIVWRSASRIAIQRPRPLQRLKRL